MVVRSNPQTPSSSRPNAKKSAKIFSSMLTNHLSEKLNYNSRNNSRSKSYSNMINTVLHRNKQMRYLIINRDLQARCKDRSISSSKTPQMIRSKDSQLYGEPSLQWARPQVGTKTVSTKNSSSANRHKMNQVETISAWELLSRSSSRRA